MVESGLAGRRKPTSADVARAAGVSQSTVSYVLTGKRPISEETRRRVEGAIAELGFVPNSGARTLAGRRSHVIGLMIPFRAGVEISANLAFVGEIAAIARKADHDVLLVTSDEGPAGLSRLRDSGMCDGLILMDVEARDPRVEAARGLGVPCVVIGVPDDRSGLSCVDLDFEAAGGDAVSLLVGRGRDVIGLVSPGPHGERGEMSFTRRFVAGAEASARDRAELVAASADPDFGSLARAVDSILSARPDCRAFAVHMSSAVEPVLAILRARGLEPGVDVDVVGVCDEDVAARNRTALDALVLQPERVSAEAMDALFCQIDGTRAVGTRLELVAAPVVTRGGAALS
ncbi:LacI family DNA-binding transcriptional regulator [Demequina sp. SYSU T00192]|uniref:LacI family DNA-binding transcriptional regulator n=1 Tax=Demequina litoralis TaxID=3051660 RepID=A0ABT8G6L2_9MICO|nr:LacI family DNA-binding transcriptional regulator [Demequina sp. SYSU T00192]MDN4474780.1 LacI family DNA-binding transcriptional regulator [Demequina sp. SYSU T00192]